MIPEHADRRDEGWQALDDGRDLLGRDEARRVLDEDEPERVGAKLDRRPGVLGVGDAADLDPDHHPRVGPDAPPVSPATLETPGDTPSTSPPPCRGRFDPRKVSSAIFAPTSSARTSPSPTSTAWAPAAATRRTCAPVKKPLSLTTSGPGGMCGRRSSVVSMRVANVRRSRLLMPTTRA